MNLIVTSEYLDDHPNCIFVYGDNLIHKGKAGAAALRGHPQTYGFITKKYPGRKDTDYFTIEEYKLIFDKECKKFLEYVKSNPDKIFLVSKMGSSLANRYHIYETIIEPVISKWEDEYLNIKLVY